MIGKKGKKNILILSGSGRKNGNTQSLVEAFAGKCKKEGHQVTILELCEYQIRHCLSCNYCAKNPGICVQNDDMWQIVKKIRECDVLAFATPVYYGGISSRLKAVIEQFYGMKIRECEIKESLLLTVTGRAEQTAADQVVGYYSYLTDFMGWKDCGKICAIGYEEKGILNGKIARELIENADIDLW